MGGREKGKFDETLNQSVGGNRRMKDGGRHCGSVREFAIEAAALSGLVGVEIFEFYSASTNQDRRK